MSDVRLVEGANCRDCEWEDITGRQQTPSWAQKHANETGHTVYVEYSVSKEVTPNE